MTMLRNPYADAALRRSALLYGLFIYYACRLLFVVVQLSAINFGLYRLRRSSLVLYFCRYFAPALCRCCLVAPYDIPPSHFSQVTVSFPPLTDRPVRRLWTGTQIHQSAKAVHSFAHHGYFGGTNSFNSE